MCSNATCNFQSCNASYIYAYYKDASETVLEFTVAETRCAGTPCGNDEKCYSNKCYNASCLTVLQSKPSCTPSPVWDIFNEDDKTTKQKASATRCNEVLCQSNSTCLSNQCYNATCLSTEQLIPKCNSSTHYQSYSDATRALTVSLALNRCENTLCEEDSQCSTNYCCTGKDCNDSRGPICISKPSNPAGSKTLVIILSIIGGILLVGVIVLSVMYYKRHKLTAQL